MKDKVGRDTSGKMKRREKGDEEEKERETFCANWHLNQHEWGEKMKETEKKKMAKEWNMMKKRRQRDREVKIDYFCILFSAPVSQLAAEPSEGI